MIKIYIDDEVGLNNWYYHQIQPIIRNKIKEYDTKELNFPEKRYMFCKIEGLSDLDIRELLCGSYTSVMKRIDWLSEYLDFIIFCKNYEEFHNSIKGKDKRYQKEQRNAYLKKCPERFFNFVSAHDTEKSNEDITKTWTTMNLFMKNVLVILDNINNVISSIFQYAFLPNDVRGELYQRMGIRVCPYCNRQYIDSFKDNERWRYLGELDHLRPKSEYGLFSLSIWNLIPCCKPCNQVFKKALDKRIVEPRDRGFGDDAVLTVYSHDLKAMVGLSDNYSLAWELNPEVQEDVAELIRNSIEVFHLNDLYNNQKPEITNVLRRKATISKAYSKALERLHFPQGTECDERLLYGISFAERKYQQELLSKAIYDIVKKN